MYYLKSFLESWVFTVMAISLLLPAFLLFLLDLISGWRLFQALDWPDLGGTIGTGIFLILVLIEAYQSHQEKHYYYKEESQNGEQ